MIMDEYERMLADENIVLSIEVEKLRRENERLKAEIRRLAKRKGE